jgi:hypothetical protein
MNVTSQSSLIAMKITFASWHALVFGLNQIAGRQPVCIGTVLATQRAMLDMLDEFTAVMASAPCGCIEQAIFNHMVHTDMFRTKLEMVPNITSLVATLGSMAKELKSYRRLRFSPWLGPRNRGSFRMKMFNSPATYISGVVTKAWITRNVHGCSVCGNDWRK